MFKIRALDPYIFHRAMFIMLGIGLVFASPVLSSLSFEWQIILLGGFVLVIGMPHGALDPLIARKYGASFSNFFQQAGFYTSYVAIAAMAIGLWYMLPWQMLIAFLVVSVIHFADDWRGEVPRWIQLLAATSLITNPSYFFTDEVTKIFEFLTFGTPMGWFVDILYMLAFPVLVLLVTGLSLESFKGRKGMYAFIEILILHTLASAFQPLVYFILYFCGLHSIRHYIRTISDLKKSGYDADKIVFTIEWVFVLTVVLAALAYFFVDTLTFEEGVLQVVFIGLFALTLPHMFLLGYIYARHKK